MRLSLSHIQWCALFLLAVLVLGFSLGVAATMGSADISLVNVRDILHNHLFSGDIPVKSNKDAIVWEDRIPRSLVAACCGAGLGLCGVLMQSLLRNPLADPYILGISSGAGTGAVLFGVLGLGSITLGLSFGAFAGALLAFFLVLLLANLAGGTTDKVILSGIAITQLFSALTSLIIFALADSDQTRGVMFWLLGSLEGIRWGDVALAVAVVTVSAAICWYFAYVLDAFAFGDDIAGSLGIPVRFARYGLLILAALLTATLVSIAGSIGFVGLVLPHLARLVVGSRHNLVIPFTLIFGAIFMVWVDTFSRVVFSPTPLPAGVGTALVGVPVFIALLLRKRRNS